MKAGCYQVRNLLDHHPSVCRHAGNSADERQPRRTREDLHGLSPVAGKELSENTGMLTTHVCSILAERKVFQVTFGFTVRRCSINSARWASFLQITTYSYDITENVRRNSAIGDAGR